MISPRETHGNILVPEWYSPASSKDIQDVDPADVFYFIDRQRERYGPYLLDKDHPALAERMAELRSGTKTVNRVLHDELKARELPLEAKGNRSTSRLIRQGRRRLVMLLRPPFFSTDKEDKSDRLQQEIGCSNFVIHIDELGRHHRTRWFNHKGEGGNREYLNLFSDLVASNVDAQSRGLNRSAGEEDWETYARSITRIVEACYVNITEGLGSNDWVLPTRCETIPRKEKAPVRTKSEVAV